MINIVGQERAKKTLALIAESFFAANRQIPTLGVFGSSGLGKTFLVEQFAKAINAQLIYINGSSVKDPMAFRAFFKDAYENQNEHHVVFIDECHMLPRKVQENMLSVLESPAVLCTIAPKDLGLVDCVDGKRYIEKGDIVREKLPTNMSFVLATTDPAMLKNTILSRVRKIHLDPYTEQEKAEIAKNHLATLGLKIDDATAQKIAQRSRSIRHLKGEICETMIDVHNVFTVDIDAALSVVDDMLGLDGDGATLLDKNYLRFLAANEIAGIDTIAGYLKIDKKEVTTHIEPFLMEKGWIAITGKGRILTKTGYNKVLGTPVQNEDTNVVCS